MKIAHIINVIPQSVNQDLYDTQSITIESLKHASKLITKEFNVEIFGCHFSDENVSLDLNITLVNTLSKSTNTEFNVPNNKRLPLIHEVVNCIPFHLDDHDYYIYSNLDICLMPHFYMSIHTLLKQNFDAIAINRRTVHNAKGTNSLASLYKEIGHTHEGIDCFVYSRKIKKDLIFFNSFIGSGPVGLCFTANMLAFSSKFHWCQDNNLTFHIGDDKSWTSPRGFELQKINYEQLNKICNNILEQNPKMMKQKKLVLSKLTLFSFIMKSRTKVQSPTFIIHPKDLIALYSKDKLDYYLKHRVRSTLIIFVRKFILKVYQILNRNNWLNI